MKAAAQIPAGFTRVPFDASHGLPQSATFAAGTRSLRLVLTAVATDLPALIAGPETEVVVDLASAQELRPTSLPTSPARRFELGPAPILGAEAIRAYLLLLDGTALVASQPVVVGRRLDFALAPPAGFLIEVFVASLDLRVGTLVRPGVFGASIEIGARSRLAGVARWERPSAEEVSLYDLLP